jgi:hypothetical protein
MSDAAEGNVAANERHLTLKNLKFFSPLRREFVVERYGIALATAALAIVLRWIFDPLLGHVAFTSRCTQPWLSAPSYADMLPQL